MHFSPYLCNKTAVGNVERWMQVEIISQTSNELMDSLKDAVN